MDQDAIENSYSAFVSALWDGGVFGALHLDMHFGQLMAQRA